MPVPTPVFDPRSTSCAAATPCSTSPIWRRAAHSTRNGRPARRRPDDKAVYLRGSEEHQHHRWCCGKPWCRPATALVSRSAMTAISTRRRFLLRERHHLCLFRATVPGPHAAVHRSFGFQIELYATMEKRPHLLRRYDLYKGCHPQRLDHFNVFAPEVQSTVDFYAGSVSPQRVCRGRRPERRIAAAWLHRKGNVHDFAITNGKGPRLHHFAYWCRPR